MWQVGLRIKIISFSGEIDELANAINEQSSEEKKMVSVYI
jgi:hypothetical protein